MPRGGEGLGTRQELCGPPVEEQWSPGGKPVAMGLRQRMRCVPMGQRHLHEKIGGGGAQRGGVPDQPEEEQLASRVHSGPAGKRGSERPRAMGVDRVGSGMAWVEHNAAMPGWWHPN